MIDPLDGIDLVVFDKDGTLIGFDTMWTDWVVELGDRLSDAVGWDVRSSLYMVLGYDDSTGTVTPGGALAATPMARLREMTAGVLVACGSIAKRSRSGGGRGLVRAGSGAPDPSARRSSGAARGVARRRPADRDRDE